MLNPTCRDVEREKQRVAGDGDMMSRERTREPQEKAMDMMSREEVAK